MARWLVYIKERFPLSVYLILVTGFVASGMLLSEDNWTWERSWIAELGLLLFFAELRLMDEVKDYAKDMIAHPKRPLPRGILKVPEVENVIRFAFFTMLVFSGVIGLASNFTAFALYLGLSLYLWLMYREFYQRDTVVQFPLFYAISHQIILIPLCLFTVAIHAPELTFSETSMAYSISVLGAFFCYEVCRKLDPNAHPVLKTYLSVYGPFKTALLVLVLLAVAAQGAWNLGAFLFLFPIDLLLFFSLGILIILPSKYKIIELFATLTLAAHIWATPLQTFLRNFS
jgi:hypothetical protein